MARSSIKNLYTVGYEGRDIDDFVAGLVKKKIKIVADVRKNPVSRKRGFSKSRLAEALGAAGIEYLHFPGLGVPTEWRKQAKAEVITRAKMFGDYRRRILPKAIDDIATITKLMRHSRLALLCYECDASDCHRSYVARKITSKDHIKDLVIPPGRF